KNIMTSKLLARCVVTLTLICVSLSFSAIAQDAKKRNPSAINLQKLTEKAGKGDLNAQHDLGGMYYYGNEVKQDYAEATKWYRKAAEQGDVRSQYNLGLMYESGLGLQKDKSEAMKWYQM